MFAKEGMVEFAYHDSLKSFEIILKKLCSYVGQGHVNNLLKLGLHPPKSSRSI